MASVFYHQTSASAHASTKVPDLAQNFAIKPAREAVEKIKSRSKSAPLKFGRDLELECRAPATYDYRMSKKVRWGVLSTANIGVKKVLPGMQLGQYSTVTAIASRDLTKARAAADALGISKAYGSYEELLADVD
jgi:hypothetical protein